MSIYRKIIQSFYTNFNFLIDNGAYIVDVRTPSEFNNGSISNSVNIPLDKLDSRINDMHNRNKPVIFCCASGIRSGKARSIAKSKGLEVYNGGSWTSLKRKIS